MSNTATDQEALWAQLQEVQRKEMEKVKQERMELEKEKATMNAVSADGSDIVDINVGGEAIIQAHRSTLCLAPQAMFSHMFSGRWDESIARDSEGRIFLDHDPELVRLIVNHLRTKRIEDPSETIHPPKIPDGKVEEFRRLIRYFGLFSYFYPRTEDSLDFSGVSVRQAGSLVTLRTMPEDSLQLKYSGSGHYFVAVTPPIHTDPGCSWKVTINTLISNAWMYIGVVGKQNATVNSYRDLDSYGWAGSGQVYQQGSPSTRPGGWSGFAQGECLYFQLLDSKLTMFSMAKMAGFSIDNITASEMYIYFNFHTNAKITLSPLGTHELQRLTDAMV